MPAPATLTTSTVATRPGALVKRPARTLPIAQAGTAMIAEAMTVCRNGSNVCSPPRGSCRRRLRTRYSAPATLPADMARPSPVSKSAPRNCSATAIPPAHTVT